MESRDLAPAGARALVILASVIIVVAGLRAASAIMVPLLVAVFVSLLSFPVLFWLLSKRMPSALAVSATILVDLAVLAGAVLVVTGSVNELAGKADKYQERLSEYQEGLVGVGDRASRWLAARGIAAPEWLAASPASGPSSAPAPAPASVGADAGEATVAAGPSSEDSPPISNGGEWLVNLFDWSSMLEVANRTLRGIAATLSNTLIVVLITTFILLEAVTFRRKLRVAFGDGHAEERFDRILADLRHYLGLKTAISALTGITIGVWLSILGSDFAMLLGLAAFLLNFIPSLGSILAAVPAVLLAMVQQGVGTALLVGLGYVVVNLVLGNFVEPYLMGRRLGLSTLVVLLSLVFWGWVWGPIGMLLSVPLTMIVKLTLENSEEFRWLAVLLGNLESEPPRRRWRWRRRPPRRPPRRDPEPNRG